MRRSTPLFAAVVLGLAGCSFLDQGDRSGSVAVVGDSLTAPIEEQLATGLWDAGWRTVDVDGVAGRQIPESVPRPLSGVLEVRDLLETSADPDVVVVALGTNDMATSGDADELDGRIRQMLDEIGPDREVLWVNTAVAPPSDMGARAELFNAVLAEAADERGVQILDWASVAADDPTVFGPDGVHLSDHGNEVRTALVLDAVGERWRVAS